MYLLRCTLYLHYNLVQKVVGFSHRMTDQRLRIFQTNDTDRLYSIALKLWSNGVFNYYLTNQQLLVLEQILNGNPNGKKLFDSFLESKVSLKFVEPTKSNKEESSKKDDDEQQSTEAPATLSATPDKSRKENDDVQEQDNNGSIVEDSAKLKQNNEASEVNEVLSEPSITNGVESARALALKLRYILWDRAIDLLYDQRSNEDEYEIFENDFNDAETNGSSLPGQDLQKKEISTGRNISDDYDDYDDDEEEEEGDDESKKETLNDDTTTQNELESLHYDEKGNVILEVPITQNEDTHQLENKTIIENFNKIYHNFENDKETLIKRRRLEENDMLLENESSNTKDLFSMNLGAANLSLKHLLYTIEENKEKLNLQDNDLRHLIMDVRKNRSKWASDDKIGQEELYEACEKVVMELRGYTEHSTAFLNKVSKREAPNYLQVIKKPMDLNTILKNLKNFQYKSKTEFVDDVMLIWKNCLTYNSDPRHFLRAHAIAMQKKSLTLIPIIPDITIRSRSEVEAEAEDTSTPQPQGKTGSKKGKKRTRNGEIKEENQSSSLVNNDTPKEGAGTTPSVSTQNKASTSDETPIPDSTALPPSLNGVTNTSTLSTPIVQNKSINLGEDTEMDDEDNGESNEIFNSEDNDKDDLELQNWKNLTAKVRADLCTKRSELFRDNKLNNTSDAILRDSRKMKQFESYLKNYTDTKKLLFRPSNKQQDSDPYLIEYDVTGGLPALEYKGVDDEEIEREEAKLVDQVLEQGGLKPSDFVPKPTGLNKIFNENIEEMQEIRKICFKVSLIRQMQQQQFLHHSQMKAPEIEKIDDSIDLDPLSRLDNRDKLNKDLIYAVLKKRVSKVAMQSGFESTELFAVETLTQIAGDYMNNLVRTIKSHLETPSLNKEQKQKSILHLSLLQNGIRKPDELHTYVHENILRQHEKLKDLKQKLSHFLKTLLRPAFDMNSEQTFKDNSEQFLSGDFSNEIGEDFFGFKELGLDKEFDMVGNSIPLHLLYSRYTESNTEDSVKKVGREDFENAPFDKLLDEDIVKEIKLFQPLLQDSLSKTKHFYTKQMKSKKEVNEYLTTVKGIAIMEDEDYPKRPTRPKLPPTGKITPAKKKVTPTTFFLEEDEQRNDPHTIVENGNGIIKDEFGSSFSNTRKVDGIGA